MHTVIRLANSALCGISAFSLSGCAFLQAQSRVDPQAVAHYPDYVHTKDSNPSSDPRCPEKLKGDTHSGAINLDCFKFIGEDKNAYSEAVGDPVSRNRLADILIGRSDTLCNNEMARLTANQAIVNTSLSVLSTSFSAASAIVTGDQAKSILSGLSGTANASRDHINAETYRNQLSPVITRAISDERKKRRANIDSGLRKPLPEYSADRMIREVNDYHHVCSFYKGLELVVKAVDRAGLTDERDREIASALYIVEEHLARARVQLAVATGTEKTKLEAQIAALIEQQTDLVAKQTTLSKESTGN